MLTCRARHHFIITPNVVGIGAIVDDATAVGGQQLRQRPLACRARQVQAHFLKNPRVNHPQACLHGD